MNNLKNWAWLLVFGSLWGISEVLAGEAFFRNHVPYASVWLSAWAFFMLGLARGLVKKPGSSTAVGATAALFKLAYAAPFYCHLLGIFFIGLIFDIAATAWMRSKKKILLGTLLTGIAAAYGGYATFAVTITYIAKYGPWVAGGTPKVLNHIFVGGSLAALTSLVFVPLGVLAGRRSGSAIVRRPAWSTAGAFAMIAAIWALGRLIS
jgi:hypothetical protein